MKIWMHTIGYPPAQIGGTEVHVQELAEGLVSRGHDVHVSVPDLAGAVTGKDARGVVLHAAQESGDLVRMIADLSPDLVHFHPLYLDNTISLMAECFAMSPVVVSYHTPTLTCMRGDLLRMGSDVCDGKVDYAKCTACILHQKGVGRIVAERMAMFPAAAYAIIAGVLGGRARSMMRWPVRVAKLKDNMSTMWRSCAQFIVVCNWLRELVLLNGMPSERISMIRYGRKKPAETQRTQRAGPLRLGYAGRLTEQKGLGVLLDAVQAARSRDFTIEICAPDFEGDSQLACRIRKEAESDARIAIRGIVAPDGIVGLMRQWDGVIVPSVWMETGPMVVTEAFHAGVPVLGSNRGGIAELVEDRRTGLLFEPGNHLALAELIDEVSAKPETLRSMVANINGGRDANTMVAEVESVYRMVLQ